LWGKSEESFWERETNKWYKGQRKNRGLYCDPLYGYWAYRGILPTFCRRSKINKKKWVLDRLPDEGESIFSRPTAEDFKRKQY